MRAIVYREYGSPDVLHLEELPRPTPGPGEVLVRVHAAAVNPLDSHFLKGFWPMRPRTGLRRPKEIRAGADMAGVVEEVGSGVTRFQPGDAVFGAARGAFADYVSATENRVAAKPASLSFAQAAALPVAGLTALQGLRDKARVQHGQRVLVNGAAGGVGSFAVQIAHALGAEVTGVCSGGKLELVRSLGAARVMDYAREDFTRGEGRYDVVFDCAGSRSLRQYARVMPPGGVLLPAGMKPGMSPGRLVAHLLGLMAQSPFARQKVIFFVAKVNADDLAALAAMCERGEITPLLGRTLPLEAAAEAVAEVRAGHTTGKLILTVADAAG